MVGLEVNPSTYDITYMRGDAHTVPFVVTVAGVVQDITGWTFKFTVKKSIDDPIASMKFQKTTGGGGITTVPASGLVNVAIEAADVEPLAGVHVYDLQAVDAGGKVKTLRLARFVVPKDVTTP